MARAMAKKIQTPPKTFEEALSELEQILSEIESGQAGLEDSLVKYERGTFLIQHCRTVLGRAEKQIEQLSKGAGDGVEVAPLNPSPETTSTPFDPQQNP
jgi:exodeoxyribonuclease VII small subunit